MKIVIALFLSLIGITRAFAHASPHSELLLSEENDELTARITLPTTELAHALKTPSPLDSPKSVERHGELIRAYLVKHIQVTTPTNQPWSIEIGQPAFTEAIPAAEQPDHEHSHRQETPGAISVELRLTPPQGGPADRFWLDCTFINHEVISHRIYVVIENKNEPSSRLDVHSLIRSNQTRVQIQIPD